MKKSYSYDLSGMNVGELIEFLQSLPKEYRDWPIYCCGSDQFFLCFNEGESCVVVDTENLYENYDDEWDDILS